jgi:hypothetical protein
MRSWIAGSVLVVLQVSGAGAGQVVDAGASRFASAGSDFRFSGEPIVMAGTSYYPSGPTVFFDGAVMVRSSTFKGVPLYVDATRDPYNVIYVPIGAKLMRPYERRRTDQAADTLVTPPSSAPAAGEEPAAEAVDAIAPGAPAGDQQAARVRPWVPVHAVSALHPGSNRGIWIVFDDKIWLLSDRQPYPAANIKPSGTYHGFPVYRDAARPKEIYISSGAAGFIARYTLEERR